jgi:hypothetical protein
VSPPGPRIPPPLTRASRPYWTSGASGRLRLLRDRRTGRWLSPFEEIPEGAEPHEEDVSGKGVVFTFTVNHHRYHPDVPPPYVIAIVELNEQADLRVPTNLVNCDFDELRIGMPVRVRFEAAGEIHYPLFEPDL